MNTLQTTIGTLSFCPSGHKRRGHPPQPATNPTVVRQSVLGKTRSDEDIRRGKQPCSPYAPPVATQCHAHRCRTRLLNLPRHVTHIFRALPDKNSPHPTLARSLSLCFIGPRPLSIWLGGSVRFGGGGVNDTSGQTKTSTERFGRVMVCG